jgi:hypothetical protein
MPRKKTNNNWEVTNIHRNRDRRGLGSDIRGKSGGAQIKRQQKDKAKSRKIKSRNNQSCAVTALSMIGGVGLAAATVIGALRGWA